MSNPEEGQGPRRCRMKGSAAEAPHVSVCGSWDCIRTGAGLSWESHDELSVLSDAARTHSVSGCVFLCLFAKSILFANLNDRF